MGCYVLCVGSGFRLVGRLIRLLTSTTLMPVDIAWWLGYSALALISVGSGALALNACNNVIQSRAHLHTGALCMGFLLAVVAGVSVKTLLYDGTYTNSVTSAMINCDVAPV